MIVQLAHNIISSLGFSSEENYRAVKEGKTNLCLHENYFNLPEPFVGALIDEAKLNAEFEKINTKHCRYTKFEKMAGLGFDGSIPDLFCHFAFCNLIVDFCKLSKPFDFTLFNIF